MMVSTISDKGDSLPNSDTLPSEKEKDNSPSARCPVGKSSLSVLELSIYALFVAAVLIPNSVSFYQAFSSLDLLPQHYFKLGWFGRFKDVSLTTFETFSEKISLILASHILFLVISRLTLHLLPLRFHQIICSWYTIGWVAYVFSVNTAAFILALFLLTFICSYVSVIVVWLFIIAILYSMSSSYFYYQILTEYCKVRSNEVGMVYAILGYLICRYLSFADCVQKRLRVTQDVTYVKAVKQYFVLCFHYCFYWPYFLSGPTLTFKDFEIEIQSTRSIDWRWVISRVLRLTFWYFVSHIILHYFYFNAVLLEIREIDTSFSYSQLILAMYMRGQFFMLEYLQYYGVAVAVGAIDGVKLYDWPDCISRVTTYRDMWRVFDRGLFAIVRDHVYIPLGGSRHGLLWQFIATAAGFAFICLYHGHYWEIKVWILLNFIQVILEVVIQRLYKSYLRLHVISLVGHTFEYRITGFLNAVNLLYSSFSIFYFFYPSPINYNIIFIVAIDPLVNGVNCFPLMVLLLMAYCYVQFGKEYAARGCKTKSKEL